MHMHRIAQDWEVLYLNNIYHIDDTCSRVWYVMNTDETDKYKMTSKQKRLDREQGKSRLYRTTKISKYNIHVVHVHVIQYKLFGTLYIVYNIIYKIDIDCIKWRWTIKRGIIRIL